MNHGFLQSADGTYSSNRLAFLGWCLGVLAVWGFLSVKASALQPIPESLIMILGILMTGKVAQVFGERKEPVQKLPDIDP